MPRYDLIAATRGAREFDLAILNANLVNVFTCEVYPADIGIFEGRIALVAPAGVEHLEARQVIDGTGKWAAPGFIDSHVHIESSMVTPPPFAEAVVPMGTTAVVIDPHEIGNVFGRAGIRYMLDTSEGLPLRVLVTISSCVPAAEGIETAGAAFHAEDIREMLGWPRVVGIAEVMDFPAVISGAPRMVEILEVGIEANTAIQGHSPQVRGRALNAYLAAGIHSDHETVDPAEMHEKLQLGMLPFVRSGSFRSVGQAIPDMLNSLPFMEVALCTDDIFPADLLARGHMDRVIREMIAGGVMPALAYRAASLNAARHYGFRDLGGIAPGYVADLVLLSDLEDVRASVVIANGRIVARDGALLQPAPRPAGNLPARNSVIIPDLTPESFHMPAPITEGEIAVNAIRVLHNRYIDLETITLRVENGHIDYASLPENVCISVVIPRHGQAAAASFAPVTEINILHGAMASTVAHDSHNLIVVGRNPEDMLLAARTLKACGGG
ncbi:MAG: adenine deaminase, partial [Anaerolineae bacterium]|nr:adenine deaminase [Anaerolineae bacterium]